MRYAFDGLRRGLLDIIPLLHVKLALRLGFLVELAKSYLLRYDDPQKCCGDGRTEVEGTTEVGFETMETSHSL